MKKNFATIIAITVMAISITSCKDKAKEASTTKAEEVKTAEATTDKYSVDLDASIIEWKGFKPTGSHYGTINLESGVFNVSGGEINSGTFLIKMSTIKDADSSAKLEGHLKSPDFFDVEKYPNAAFEITGLEDVEGKTMLSGNLTLKEVKNNVTFSVSVTNENNTMTLSSESFTIDRTKWNVQYKSKSIFDNLGDKFINDDIELKITVKASKS